MYFVNSVKMNAAYCFPLQVSGMLDVLSSIHIGIFLSFTVSLKFKVVVILFL